jgi:hypothetical protein
MRSKGEKGYLPPRMLMIGAVVPPDTQAEQLIARMKAARGYIYPEWELAARTDPDFTEALIRRGPPPVSPVTGSRVPGRHRMPAALPR